MKKFSFTLFLILSLILFFWNVFAEEFSQEMEESYEFSYENNITTIDDIKKANMNWSLTRIAMAKMLSNYAMNSLGREPDTSKNPNFKDVSKELDGDYNNWVTLAYQLGIMWVWIDKFRPYDLVTRAEFGTAFSRVLFWNIYNQDWKEYYKRHLEALKDAWIMTKIDKPQQGEVRWFVMIMLNRSHKKWIGRWNWNWNNSNNSNNSNNGNEPNDNSVIIPNQNNNKTWDNKSTTWNNQTSTWNTSSRWWWGWWGWWGWWSWWSWWWNSSTSTTAWYTVTWLSWDWTVLEIDKNVEKGSYPEYNWVTPTFEENWTIYNFLWWEPGLSAVNWDITYQAKPSNLLKDKEDRLNVVLIWYWGYNYEWYFLIPDSITVASWDLNTNDVTLISLPYNGYYENYQEIFYQYFGYSNFGHTYANKNTVNNLAEDIKK